MNKFALAAQNASKFQQLSKEQLRESNPDLNTLTSGDQALEVPSQDTFTKKNSKPVPMPDGMNQDDLELDSEKIDPDADIIAFVIKFCKDKVLSWIHLSLKWDRDHTLLDTSSSWVALLEALIKSQT
jgi:hypothetical protein